MRFVFTAVTCGALALSFLASAQTAPKPNSGIQLGDKPTEFLLAKITVSDLDKSLSFYVNLLGMTRDDGKTPPRIDPAAPVTSVPLNFSGSVGDPFLVLVKQKDVNPERSSAKLTTVGIKVLDTRAAIARVKAAGYAVITDAREAHGGMMIGTVQDPDGYVVEIIQTASAEPATKQGS